MINALLLRPRPASLSPPEPCALPAPGGSLGGEIPSARRQHEPASAFGLRPAFVPAQARSTPQTVSLPLQNSTEQL